MFNVYNYYMGLNEAIYECSSDFFMLYIKFLKGNK